MDPLTDLDLKDVTTRLESAGHQLARLGFAALQFLFALVCAILLARYMRRLVRRRTQNSPSPTITVLVQNGSTAAVYIVTFTVLLTFWGLTWSSLITALSISTVAVAFGFQDLLRSFVGGMLVLLEHPFSLGDRIKIRDLEGKVERIDLRTITVRADNGDKISLPNALLLSDPVINRSPNRVYRVFNVSGIDANPSEVKDQVKKAMEQVQGVDTVNQISVRTKQSLARVRRAVESVPGIDLPPESPARAQSRAIGFRVIWAGDAGIGTSARVKERLLEIYPGARITDVRT